MPEPPALTDFLSEHELASIIARTRREDLGDAELDVTSRVLLDGQALCTGKLVARQAGVLAGAAILPALAQAYDSRIELTVHAQDASAITPGQCIAELRGPAISLLALERVALNFLAQLSGVATLTHAYVRAVEGTNARIYDTRKTIPGLRTLQKYAVTCGGGHSHRMGLYDAMLIKDNHLAALPSDELAEHLKEHISRARSIYRDLAFVELEVDTLEQLEQLIGCGVDVVLLDNMSVDQMQQAIATRARLAPGVELEASGGVNLESVAAIAQTGIERIAVGAITHSAPAIDLALDLQRVAQPATSESA